MNKVFLIGSIIVIITGLSMGRLAIMFALFYQMYFFAGQIITALGFILLITGIFSKSVAETKHARILGIIMILSSVLVIAGIFAAEIGMIVSIAGAVFILLIFLIWPCLCCQGMKDISPQVIGVASAHDKISIDEICGITGLGGKIVRETLYDAIGKGRLSGRVEGDTFVRLAPTTTTYSAPSTTTREREIVKVMVICPYCGAKTEQGIGKCQNCQADL